MIRFATKPDSVFISLINDSCDLGMDMLKENGAEFDTYWLDEYTYKIFGSSVDILHKEIGKLHYANNSSDLLMPTDYHFRLLDRIIEWYCEIYNDTCKIDDSYELINGIKHFDIDTIRSTFFWDNDYDLIDTLVQTKYQKDILKILGVTPSGINIQQGKLADLGDFTFEKYQPDPDWEEIEDNFWISQ
jgi:hypothetical protein